MIDMRGLLVFTLLITEFFSKPSLAQDRIAQATLSTLTGATEKSTPLSKLKSTNLNLPKNTHPILLRNTLQSCMGSSDQKIIRNDQTLGTTRNQDSVGWCFAYSSADLLSHQLGLKVSASDIAITSLYDPNVQAGPGSAVQGKPKMGDLEIQNFKNGIHPLVALDNIGGYCPESVMRSDDTAIPDTYESLQEKIRTSPDITSFENGIRELEKNIKIEENYLTVLQEKININKSDKGLKRSQINLQQDAFQKIKKYRSQKEEYLASIAKNTQIIIDSEKKIYSFLMNIESIKDEFDEKKSEQLVCKNYERISLIFPHLDYATVLGAVKESKNSKDFIRWLQNMSCKNHRQTFSDKVKLYQDFIPSNERKRGKSFFATIDEQLKNGNIVETVYYPMFMASDFLIQEKKESLKKAGKDPELYKEYLHASVIVGKRFEGGKCQYLIRNSWGTGCGEYNLNRVQCDQGNLWVNEADLDENMIGMTYLEKP